MAALSAIAMVGNASLGSPSNCSAVLSPPCNVSAEKQRRFSRSRCFFPFVASVLETKNEAEKYRKDKTRSVLNNRRRPSITSVVTNLSWCSTSSAAEIGGRRHGAYAQGASLRDQAEASSVSLVSPSTPDLFLLDLASKIEDSLAEGDDLGNDVLARLREEATEATLGCRWPTNKDEAYRFTDVKFLKLANIVPVNSSSESSFNPESLNLPESEGSRLVFIDGVLSKTLSRVDNLPEGVIVGSISSIPQEAVRKFVLPRLSGVAERSQRDVFACLNGVGARDLVVVIVPAGVKVTKPLYVLYYSSSQGSPSSSSSVASSENSSYALSNPRLLVTVGKDSELDFVEDFSGAPESLYWSNSVCEIEIHERGRVGHSYVQEQSRHAVHIRQTYVSQVEASSYKLVEAVFGGRLSRHNLHIQQLGPDTVTEMSTFLLAGRKQLHDLHSKLVLDHPRGISRQLHKCIVSDSSGHGVFDGNVRVNRLAQQTDAGQLSRNLLLAPRATVNVKPNLQIIANDVKCSHGAAISDLEEEQLFYFRARGIDAMTARSALVFSFGAEVLQKLEGAGLRKRVESLVKNSLAEEGYMNPELAVTI
ncbi:hypothetical protein R1flu_002356 [Riccia fluitans]|uniref:Uncharacterized protein n=1 Tax=Riccia fluitans TaxID=41844 RepID=A0ABD1Y600_9MARC